MLIISLHVISAHAHALNGHLSFKSKSGHLLKTLFLGWVSDVNRFAGWSGRQ